MLDTLVQVQNTVDPDPGEHRPKQLCPLPITLQGLPGQKIVLSQMNGMMVTAMEILTVFASKLFRYLKKTLKVCCWSQLGMK